MDTFHVVPAEKILSVIVLMRTFQTFNTLINILTYVNTLRDKHYQDIQNLFELNQTVFFLFKDNYVSIANFEQTNTGWKVDCSQFSHSLQCYMTICRICYKMPYWNKETQRANVGYYTAQKNEVFHYGFLQ